MHIVLRIISAPVLVALAACATFEPTVVSASETSVTYRISPDRLEETRAVAQEYCANYGRTARLDRVTPTGEGRSVAAFSCS